MKGDRASLQANWDMTTGYLSRARAMLPAAPAASDDGATLENLEGFLEHNELALALDELTGLGVQSGAPLEFWKLLKAAATNMHIADQSEIDEHLNGA